MSVKSELRSALYMDEISKAVQNAAESDLSDVSGEGDTDYHESENAQETPYTPLTGRQPPARYTRKANDEFMKEVAPHIPKQMIPWLERWGYFEVPASNQHGFYEGGLYDHSAAVTGVLETYLKQRGIKFQNDRSLYIVGMFHDLCKLDDMAKDAAGNYIRNPEPQFGTGHGNKSVEMLEQFLDLTEEERLCIAFHMGVAGTFTDNQDYEHSTEGQKAFYAAVSKYPTVAATHDADYHVSTVMRI